jgi:hypothetical protein
MQACILSNEYTNRPLALIVFTSLDSLLLTVQKLQ